MPHFRTLGSFYGQTARSGYPFTLTLVKPSDLVAQSYVWRGVHEMFPVEQAALFRPFPKIDSTLKNRVNPPLFPAA
jgi:hypothetical protein